MRYSSIVSLLGLVLAFGESLHAQTIINVPNDTAPTQITGDTIINVLPGGSLPYSFDAYNGATINVQGGSTGHYLSVNSGSELNLFSGVIGDSPLIYSGSTANIYGGRVGNTFRAYEGSVANIEDGELGHYFRAHTGSTVNIRGGELGVNLEAYGNAVINMEGGSVGAFSDLYDQAVLNISGGAFRAGGGNGPGLGLHAHAGTTVNMTGGSIHSLDVESGVAVTMSGGWLSHNGVVDQSTLSVSGGTLGWINIFSGGVATMTGGHGTSGAQLRSGGIFRVSGGAFADDFDADPGSFVEIQGFDFRIDGVLVSGLENVGDETTINVPSASIFSGTLADGTPFVFSGSQSDAFAAGVVTVVRSAAPALVPLVEVSSASNLGGVRDGQTLRLLSGGSLPRDFTAGTGSVVHMEGGAIGHNFEALAADVQIAGGTIGIGFGAFADTTVTVSGGRIDSGFRAHSGSTVTIEGGALGNDYDGRSFFSVDGSAELTLRGGVLGDATSLHLNANVAIEGQDFRINGESVAGLDSDGDEQFVNIPIGALFSGTLADGSPFAFWKEDTLGAPITLRRETAPAASAAVIEVPLAPAPQGVRAGQTLIVNQGGSIPNNFNAAPGSRVEVHGGTVGANFEAVGAEVDILGGSVLFEFDVLDQSQVVVDGGSIADVEVSQNSTLTLQSGSITGGIIASQGATVTIAGGTAYSGATDGSPHRAESGAAIIVRGGQVGNHLTAANGGTVRIEGGVIGRPSRGNSTAVIAQAGSNVHMSGGTVAVHPLQAEPGSVVHVSGGFIEKSLAASAGADLTVTGGTINALSIAGEAELRGGRVTSETDVLSAGSLHLFGAGFSLDGLPVADLEDFGDSLLVTQREGQLLQATLSDGSLFELNLNSVNEVGQDHVHPAAQLRLTLAPLTADFNADGAVNADDLATWQNAFGTSPNGDTDGDGDTDGADLLSWQRQLGSPNAAATTAAVPEPATGHAILIGLAAFIRRPTRDGSLR